MCNKMRLGIINFSCKYFDRLGQAWFPVWLICFGVRIMFQIEVLNLEKISWQIRL